MDNTMQEEAEISLKSLFLYPLYHWKGLLAAALVIILLGSSLVGLVTFRNQRKPAPELGDTQLSQKEQLEKRIDFLKNTIRGQQEYLDNSVWIRLNPYSVWHARLCFYVDTGHAAVSPSADQTTYKPAVIATAIYGLLCGNDTKSHIAEALNMDPRQISELYQVHTDKIGKVSVEVIGDSEIQVTAIMDLVKEVLYDNIADLHSRFGPFTYKDAADISYVGADKEILDYKNALQDDMNLKNQEMAQLQAELQRLTAQAAVADRPTKMLILVVAAALVLSYGFLCVKFLVTGRLYESTELQKRWGVNILGILPPERKCCWLVKWVRRLEDRADLKNPGLYALTAHNIRNYSGENTNLLIAGDAPDALVRDVTAKLQENLPEFNLQYFGSFLSSPQSAEALGHCDGVILIEQCGTSTRPHISQEVKQVHDLGRNLIGSVIVDL